MNIFRKISDRIKYRKKIQDPTNALDYLAIDLKAKPQISMNIYVPRLNGKVDVYTVDLSTVSPNCIYTNWSTVARYNFTYTPTNNKYKKLINLEVH
jgi:hypothetical protein